MIAELPPILSGSPQRQLSDLRDYLVRLAQSLETVSEAAVVEAREVAVQASGAQSVQREEIQNTTDTLRSLIIKTADVVRHDVTVITTALEESYEALSEEWGTYQENIETTITETARNTIAEYHYTEKIESVESILRSLTGQITHGLVWDPSSNSYVLGIAIAQTIQMKQDGHEETDGGNVYREISDGQTFGLYTATGWQFWIGGVKVGWFESGTSTLHTVNLAVETEMTIGGNWHWTTLNGLGLKYVAVQQGV